MAGRPAQGGAHGASRGVYCVGCCWMLFLILVPLGVMNVAAMLAVATVVFAEKVLPGGRGIGLAAAAAMVVGCARRGRAVAPPTPARLGRPRARGADGAAGCRDHHIRRRRAPAPPQA
ncbi:MAG: DUF2182 domain-containing protein [Acidimicrobiales bacterium]